MTRVVLHEMQPEKYTHAPQGNNVSHSAAGYDIRREEPKCRFDNTDHDAHSEATTRHMKTWQ